MKRKGSLILRSMYSIGIVSVRVHQEYLVLTENRIPPKPELARGRERCCTSQYFQK